MKEKKDAYGKDAYSFLCPHCKGELSHKSVEEGIPEHLYCEKCMDAGYDMDGKWFFWFE